MAEVVAYTEIIESPKQRLLGREVETLVEFFVPGTFQSMYAAQAWCEENGYSYGSSCAPMALQGLLKVKDINIAKWKNLTPGKIAALDGIMITVGDAREGKMRIAIFKK